MNKNKLIDLIQRYHLGGNIDSVKWVVSNKEATVDFVTSDKTLIGALKVTGIDIPDSELGIYTTSQLLKLISIFDKDVTVNTNKIGDKPISLELKDKDTAVSYVLADLSVIPASAKLKQIPAFDFSLDVTQDFLTKFFKAKSALPELCHVTLNCTSAKSELIFGYSNNNNTTKITLPVSGKFDNEIKYKSFNSNYLKEILSANSDAKSISVNVSNNGLMEVKCAGTDFEVAYYLVEVSHV
jgi:hypothetical protein